MTIKLRLTTLLWLVFAAAVACGNVERDVPGVDAPAADDDPCTWDHSSWDGCRLG